MNIRPQFDKAMEANMVSDTKQSDISDVSRFDAAYARLLAARANIHKVNADEQHTDEDVSKAMDKEGECVWEIIRTRAPRRWQVCEKLQLLEDLLKDGGTTWADRREYFLLASARLDLADIDG